MIAGGGTISYYLAKQLIAAKVNVKIIEHNLTRCDELSDLLPEAMIIHGDVTERDLLMEENIANEDAVAALTDSDEENVLLSLFVRKVSKAKRMVKITRTSFEEVIDEMPVGNIVSPKNITAEYILRYVRSRQNSYDSNVETLYRLKDGKVEALEFTVGANAKVANREISTLNIRQNTLICSIYRNGNVIRPTGKECIRPKDSVIIVTTNKGLNGIDDIVVKA
jgi:trk system potassium uptake protein TrkA